MYGDLVIWFSEKWKQFWCKHDYVYRDLPAGCSHFYCKRCGRIKKED
jgi:hypothetical protein